MFALEEIFTFHKRDVMYTGVNKAPHLLTLLTDHPDIGNFEEAGFVWTYEATWHPAFLAKFYKGDVFLDAIRAPQKAYAMATGPKLYSARPIYCFGELSFYDHVCSGSIHRTCAAITLNFTVT